MVRKYKPSFLVVKKGEHGGLLAFTRWLPGDPDEYVVVLNNGDKPSSASVELPGAGRTLTPVFGASAPVTSDATGAFGPTVPAYGVAVYQLSHEDFIASGDLKLRTVLARAKALRDNPDDWQGYPLGTHVLTPSSYYLTDLEERFAS